MKARRNFCGIGWGRVESRGGWDGGFTDVAWRLFAAA